MSSKDQAACLREYNAVMTQNNDLYNALQESTTINDQKKLQDEEMRELMYYDDASSLDEELESEMNKALAEMKEDQKLDPPRNTIIEETDLNSQELITPQR